MSGDAHIAQAVALCVDDDGDVAMTLIHACGCSTTVWMSPEMARLNAGALLYHANHGALKKLRPLAVLSDGGVA